MIQLTQDEINELKKNKPLVNNKNYLGLYKVLRGQMVSHIFQFIYEQGISFLKNLDYVPSKIFEYSSLKRIDIPSNIRYIDKYAFKDSKELDTVDIEDGLTTIKEGAFALCSSLQNVRLPETLVSIGESAFAGCSSLEYIFLPDSVINIGKDAFSGCSPNLVIEANFRENRRDKLKCKAIDIDFFKEHVKWIREEGPKVVEGETYTLNNGEEWEVVKLKGDNLIIAKQPDGEDIKKISKADFKQMIVEE